MKPEYYVIRLGRNIDPNKPVVGNMPGFAAPALDQPRAGRRDRLDFVEDAPIPRVPEVFNGVDGYGQEISRSELRDPTVRFTTQEAAEACARDLSAKSPRTVFGVLGVLSAFETGPAPVIEKKFNAQGELIVLGDKE